jgi:hypothetical protein
MQGLIILFQISATLGQWAAVLLSLAISAPHPAPHHAPPHHHQPVRLPELASARLR